MAKDPKDYKIKYNPKTLANLIPHVLGEPKQAAKSPKSPRNFKQWREMTVETLSEPHIDAKGNMQIINGEPMTNAQYIAQRWVSDSKHQVDLIENAFGKVSEHIDITSKGQSLNDLTNDERVARLTTLLDAARARRDASTADNASGSDPV